MWMVLVSWVRNVGNDDCMVHEVSKPELQSKDAAYFPAAAEIRTNFIRR